MAISIGDITSGTITGSGDFDVLVRAAKEHLLVEYTAGRITGDSYAQAYIAIVNQVLAQAIQFRLGSEQINMQSSLTDEQLKLIVAQTKQVEADTLNIPKQGALLDKQVDLAQEQIFTAQKQSSLIAAQTAQVTAETLNVPKQGIVLDKQALNIDKQIAQLTSTIALTDQKTLTEKAQILDTVDGAAVEGTVGKQKAVYDAQIKGFKDDALQKAAKLMQDIWSIQRSTDTGVKPTAEAMNQDTNIGNATKTLFTSLGIPTT